MSDVTPGYDGPLSLTGTTGKGCWLILPKLPAVHVLVAVDDAGRPTLYCNADGEWAAVVPGEALPDEYCDQYGLCRGTVWDGELRA